MPDGSESNKQTTPARELRAEIEKLTHGDREAEGGKENPAEATRPRSPREFIEQRMRELDKGKKS
jgi:hypothetical protein